MWPWVALAVILPGVGYLIYRVVLRPRIALGQVEAALSVEKEHISTMEAAASEARKERAGEFDAQARDVHSSSDAAKLLRDRFRGDTPAN